MIETSICEAYYISATLMSMQLTYEQVQATLWIIVAIMVVIVLYNLLFVIVDLRKILHRVEKLTARIESIIVKPLAMTEQLLVFLSAYFDRKGKKGKKDFKGSAVYR